MLPQSHALWPVSRTDEVPDTGRVDERLAGGADKGAVLVDGTVRRRPGPWTSAVHDLLGHLESKGFTGAPRARGFDHLGREVLSYLDGQTVGAQRPWPAWTHSVEALHQVGEWLRDYHHAVADYVPPVATTWREGGPWLPGMVNGHGDPAPYNAAWSVTGLVGFFDWDNAGPTTRQEDLVWAAFAWTPLHAREVVRSEGFTAFAQRRARLETILNAYGWAGTTDEVLGLVDARLSKQVDVMRATATAGDPAYQAMLRRGQDQLLQAARRDLCDV